MSTMKCRCGSNDKIIFVKGVMIRKADNKPHVCLGAEQAPTTAEAAAELGIKHEEQLSKGHTIKQATKNKIREAYSHIRLIEETLLEEDIEVYDGKLKDNLPKLGMMIKMVDNIIRDKTNDL